MAKIYQSFSFGDAQHKIHITQDKAQADLWVCVVSNQGSASRNGLWYITKNRAEANSRVYFCARGMAELIVYFVNNKSEAGWKKSHRLEKFL